MLPGPLPRGNADAAAALLFLAGPVLATSAAGAAGDAPQPGVETPSAYEDAQDRDEDVVLVHVEPRCFGVGLMNLGETCYGAAAVQMLLSCAPYCNMVVAAFDKPDDWPPLIGALICLWRSMEQAGTGAWVSPVKLFDVVEGLDKRFDRRTQCDVEEFLGFLVSRIDDEWNTASLPMECVSLGPPSCVFQFVQQSTLRRHCGHTSEKSDAATVLQLPLLPGRAVGELVEVYCTQESLSGIECEGCSNRVNADKTITLAGSPAFAIITFKRFCNIQGVISRRTDDVLLEPMICGTVFGAKSARYALRAVACHQGATLNCGHYVTYRCDMRSSKWYKCDDSCADVIVDARDVMFGERVMAGVYVALYERVDGLDYLSAPRDLLGVPAATAARVLIERAASFGDHWSTTLLLESAAQAFGRVDRVEGFQAPRVSAISSQPRVAWGDADIVAQLLDEIVHAMLNVWQSREALMAAQEFLLLVRPGDVRPLQLLINSLEVSDSGIATPLSGSDGSGGSDDGGNSDNASRSGPRRGADSTSSSGDFSWTTPSNYSAATPLRPLRGKAGRGVLHAGGRQGCSANRAQRKLVAGIGAGFADTVTEFAQKRGIPTSQLWQEIAQFEPAEVNTALSGAFFPGGDCGFANAAANGAVVGRIAQILSAGGRADLHKIVARGGGPQACSLVCSAQAGRWSRFKRLRSLSLFQSARLRALHRWWLRLHPATAARALCRCLHVCHPDDVMFSLRDRLRLCTWRAGRTFSS